MENGSMILVGFNDQGSYYGFRPVRGFLNTDDGGGLADARQYINMLIEAKPYDGLPVVKVMPTGLRGGVPAELTRDEAVEIGELFPLPLPLDTEEALAALREQLTGEHLPDCAENTGKGDCALPMTRSADGRYLCVVHAALTCANSGRDLDTPCVGIVKEDDESGLLLCAAHRDDTPVCADLDRGFGPCEGEVTLYPEYAEFLCPLHAEKSAKRGITKR